jgi:hypothetical protein
MANQLLEEDKLRNITSADYLTILSELSGAGDVAKANIFRDLTGRQGAFSFGASGLGSSLKSAMALRDDEIEAEILRRQREAIADGTIERLGGGIEGQMKWWTESGLPNQFATKARTVFQSIQGEIRAEDPYQHVGTLWKPGTHQAKQFKNKEEEHAAREAGYTSSTRPQLYSNVGTLWNAEGGRKEYRSKSEEYDARQRGFTLTAPPPDDFQDVGTLWDSQGDSKTYQNKEGKFNIMEEGFNRTSPDAGYDVGTLWNRDTGASANYTTKEQEILLRQRGYKHTSPKSTTADPLKVVYDSGKKRVVWRLDSVIKAKNAETEDYYLPVSSDKGVNNSFVMAGILADIPLEFIQRYQRTGLSGLDIKMSEEDLKTLKQWIEAYSKDINKWHAIGKLLDNPIGDITVGG